MFSIPRHMTRVEYEYLRATTERRRKNVKDFGTPDDSTSEESESDSPTTCEHFNWRLSQLPVSAYDIMKAMRCIKDGDQDACATALCSMMHIDYTNGNNASAVLQDDGLELLVNLLEVNDQKCRVKALEVMKQLTVNKKIATAAVLLGIAPILVNRLIHDALEAVVLACDVISNIAHRRRAVRAVRRTGGISILVTFLDVRKDLLIAPKDSLSDGEKVILKRAKSAAYALWQLSKYSKVKILLIRTGLVTTVSTVMLADKRSLFIPLAGVLSEASTLPYFQMEVENEGLVGILLHKSSKVNDPLVQRMCCRILMLAAHGRENVRHMMRYHEGLEVLVSLLANSSDDNEPLLTAIIGAIWKNAISIENVKIFEQLGVVEMFFRYLHASDAELASVAAGAVAEMAKLASCREDMVRRGAVGALAAQLTRSLPPLLPTVCQALRECAKDEQGIKDIETYDVVRRLWSLLTHSDLQVRLHAALALEPCIRYTSDSSELVQSITNSILLLINLLKEENVEFLQAVCAIVTLVALDEEILTVMTEQGIVDLLSAITLRDFDDKEEKKFQKRVRFRSRMKKSDILEQVKRSNTSPIRVSSKKSLAERALRRKKVVPLHRTAAAAIANCCTRADNRQRFGALGVIPRLVQFLSSGDALLKAQACRALHALSFSAANCVIIHALHAVPLLLCAIGSCNEMTQTGAAGCMYNLRNLLLRSENKKLKRKKERCGMLSTTSSATESQSFISGSLSFSFL